MDIFDNIVNFLSMENTGALLIVGAWGSGKTYYIDNVVFKKLREGENPRQCIRVSLFGVKNTNEIPYRVFQAYTDQKVKDTTSGFIKLDKIRDWTEGIVKSIPKLKELVDLSPLFTKGNAAYSFVPDSTVICFDDIERAAETLDINEILGAVNELVENRHYKVLLVANKEYIDSKLAVKQKNSNKEKEDSEQNTKNDVERELFYEKVVEKTIAYEPDIMSIYKELVEKYGDDGFTAFMLHETQQDIINPENANARKYRKLLQNIRTLKFSIEHFFQIWKDAEKEDIDDNSSLNYRKLHNYWLFTHSIAVEQKADHLKYDDDHGLSQAINIANSIFGSDDEGKKFFEDDDEDLEPEVDVNYVVKFKERYYEPFNETFVFYKSIFDFVTASKTLDMVSTIKVANRTFNVVNGKIDPATEILETLLTKGFWNYTNEETPQKLNTLLMAVEKGELCNYVAYYNSGVYLFGFSDLIGKTEQDLKDSFVQGITEYTQRLPEVSILTKTQIEVLPPDEANSKWLKNEIIKAIENRITEDNKNSAKELEQQFFTDIIKFVSNFVIEQNKTPQYFHVPVLNNIDVAKVRKRIPALEPNDVMQLYSFINIRYLMVDSRAYVDELPFLQAISEGVKDVDTEKKVLSNKVIEQFLSPALNKAIKRIETIKDEK